LKWLHDPSTGGHSDQDVTTARVKSLFFWREMVKDIRQQFVKNCDICQMCKPVLAGSHVWMILAWISLKVSHLHTAKK